MKTNVVGQYNVRAEEYKWKTIFKIEFQCLKLGF